ncbi:NUMOD4 domain-containing protein [Flavobacterium sp.]|uniref:NUMOD4 domain-containing protein n=1 Tax=Flavobacterium sp. TaxID=239 RepID=UPI002611FF7F|nr:NUMOD4 domain-containing protein [Flavobacterium sp.]
MIRLLPNEEFKEIQLERQYKFRYAVSNYGHLVSFTDSILEGNLLKGATIDGYKILRFQYKEGDKKVTKLYFVYKLVAEYFIPKTSEDQLYVLHLDRVRDNDHVSNLKWANYVEKMHYYKTSPKVIEAKRKLLEHNIKADGKKLTETRVMFLKKILLDPNNKTKRKILAKQFGVSEMQLYRIKSGENWGHIKVEIKPKNEDK